MGLFFDSIKIAISSLLAKKTRSFLSILGIVIGILTISSLLSVALSVRSQVEGSINDLGSNLVAVVPGDISGGNISSSLGSSTLTEQDFLDIQNKVSGVRDVALAMLISGTVKSGSKSLPQAIIFASSPHMDKNLNISVEHGRFITDLDESTNAKVVVLGSKAATQLYGTTEVINKKLDLRSTTFTVIGVLKQSGVDTGFGGPDLNSVVMMPIHTGWELTNTKQVFRIMMQATSAEKVDEVKSKVKEIVLANHKGEKDFSVLSQDDLLKTVSGILNILTAMLGIIASISLLVGGIGIMNIMLVSVSERTREIGIRKAVGATQGAILLQFLIEGVILTMLGGLIAVSIYSIGVSAVPKDSPIPIGFNWNVVLLSLAFSAVVGIIFGIIPAIGAARKDPIQSLRYE